MIKVVMGIKDGKIYSEFQHEETTISENALIIRELEKIKLELLDNFEYDNDLEFQAGEEDE